MNWEKARKAALERDEYLCQRCLKPAEHVHHRQLKQMGKTYDEELLYGLANLVSLCSKCHREVHAEPARSYEQGWIVHSYDDPAAIEWKPAREGYEF